MNAKNILEGLGGILIGIVSLVIVVFIIALFIQGSTWASSKLLPWFSILTWIIFVIVVFILLPLSIPKKTRGFSSILIYFSSYIFGATLWMEGFLLTLMIWGVWAVILGIFIMGVGVVPIAIIATLVNSLWLSLVELVLLTIMTFGCRIGAIKLAESIEEAMEQYITEDWSEYSQDL